MDDFGSNLVNTVPAVQRKTVKYWVLFGVVLGITLSFGAARYLKSDKNKIDRTEAQQTILGLTISNFSSPNISQWTNDTNYLSEVNYSQLKNGLGVFMDYRPNNSQCEDGQILRYDKSEEQWTCANSIGGASQSRWGSIAGTILDQTDLKDALNAKLRADVAFGGSVSGTYDDLAIDNDSHAHTGATVSGLDASSFTSANISQWTNDSGYLTGVDVTQIANGAGKYLGYKPNDVACAHGQILEYDATLARWVCGDDSGAGAISWGSIAGTLDDQVDLNTALSGKIGLTASFGGSVSGTYDNLAIANDSHAHTGTTVSGLGASSFTSANISQWTNDSGYLTGVDVTQIANGAGKYLGYKPNDVACSDGEVLQYSVTSLGWVCAGSSSASVTVGSMTGVSLFTDATADNNWLGLGASAGRIEFDDLTVDEINLLDTRVGIGTSTPQHTLDVNGNIGLAASSYVNFGTADGTGGYGIRDSGGKLEYKNNQGTWSLVNEEYVLLRDEKAAGVNGGTCTAGAWQTRDINTEVSDSGDNATILSNQITLQPGTYRGSVVAPAFRAGLHKIRLQNITDGTTALYGTSSYNGQTIWVQTNSTALGEFTIAQPTVFEIQHQCQYTMATSGFGAATGFDIEIYAVSEFWKVR